MAETVLLPASLPGGLDLHVTNERLKKNEVRLDWTRVTVATDADLATLLGGLSLSDHADALGLGTVPKVLEDAVMKALSSGEGGGARKKSGGAPAPRPAGTRPEAWTPGPDSKPQPVSANATPSVRPASTPGTPRILQPRTPMQIRDELKLRVLRELLGPAGGPEEIVVERRVRDRYILGALAPRKVPVKAEEQDQLGLEVDGDGDDGKPDPDSVKDALLPSSLGMTFCMDAGQKALRVTAKWGRYERIEREPGGGEPSRVWRRAPVAATKDLPLKEGLIDPWSPSSNTPAVVVRGRVRRTDEGWVISLFLDNRQEPLKKSQDLNWIFQAELEIRAPDGSAAFLGRRLDGREGSLKTDEKILRLLYRDVREFAVGHGVGVHAEPSTGGPDRALALTTRVVPEHEIGRTTPPSAVEIPGLSDVELDMKILGSIESPAFAAKLLPLVDTYRAWIEARRTEAAAMSADDKETALAALKRCDRSAQRIREGIDLLGKDPLAGEAFRFMNRAMWLQRVRTKLVERVRRGETVEFDSVDQLENRTWYPFQLAFILQCLAGVTDLKHSDRSPGSEAVADLLWFPTGGGKTEAYLGLSAYVMGLRRLQGPLGGRSSEDGVAVLMRYTLRLLTLQQFQRAAALLCACEHLRREADRAGDIRWGKTPFRLGLWVGARVTPNSTDQSSEAVYQLRGNHRWQPMRGTGSPYQLPVCPWCGTKIDGGADIEVESFKSGRGRTLIYCGDKFGRCPFSRAQARTEGLPVMVVDEEMYREPPALLIATVDKLAQMAWKGEVQTLFGQVTQRCPRHGFRSPELRDTDSHNRNGALPAVTTEPCLPLRPPDLVIQDELHLISGPLGTLVGLYETAVDALASWEFEGRIIRPKVIASTATVRRAREQVMMLFRREVDVFPSPGIDYRDNFFARYRPVSEELPGRLYLGICAQGRRTKALLIRTYTALMSAAQSLYDESGPAADPWMTTVGYFNSMRELAGMRRLVDDDVAERLLRMDRRGLAKRQIFPEAIQELTSRKSSSDIPLILDRLEQPFGTKGASAPPLDVVLATNMLSVGVDVQRLGLMIVCGQPKTTAEYIQATSRVGRRFPGLVVTVFNWARPRDLSHYERFENYHARFYTQVETLSVTPFAGRALDRGLFGVLTSLIRQSGIEFNSNDRAGTLKPGHPEVQEAVSVIVDRAHGVTSSKETADDVRSRLNARLDLWAFTATQKGALPLGYREKPGLRGLLKTPGVERWGEFTCLTSLRDVEPMVPLELADPRGLDDLPEFVAPAPGTVPDVDDADDEGEDA